MTIVSDTAPRGPGASLESSEVLRLWPARPPGADEAIAVEQITVAPDGCRWIRNISSPTLTLVRPNGAGNGVAVVIAPGGGFRFVSIDNEGYDVARWLSARGFLVAVLKYRTLETPADDEAFLSQLRAGVEHHVKDNRALVEHMMADAPKAIADVEQSIRLLRALGSTCGSVGVLGFSAGGAAALGAAMSADPSARPDFVASIYGVGSAPSRLADLPPIFLAVSADDRLALRPTLEVFEALRASEQPTELHIFAGGKHGYGARPQGATSDHWIDAFAWWLASMANLLRRGEP